MGGLKAHNHATLWPNLQESTCKYSIKVMFQVDLHMSKTPSGKLPITLQAPSRHTPDSFQTPSRHYTDTIQTLSRPSRHLLIHFHTFKRCWSQISSNLSGGGVGGGLQISQLSQTSKLFQIYLGCVNYRKYSYYLRYFKYFRYCDYFRYLNFLIYLKLQNYLNLRYFRNLNHSK